MGNVVSLDTFNEDKKFEVEYILDKNNKPIGITHPDWTYTIMRNQDSKKQTALVCNQTNEPFGILDSDVFNTLLMCWVLIDDPKLIDMDDKK